MGRHNRKKSKTPSGLVSFPYLELDGSKDTLSDKEVKQNIKLNDECYQYHFKIFTSDKISNSQLKIYRAKLKASIAAWQIWISSMTALKFAVFSAVIGAIIGVILSKNGVFISKYLHIAGKWTGFLFVCVALVIEVIILRLLWNPVTIMAKIERGTFMLQVVEDSIQTRSQALSEQKMMSITNSEDIHTVTDILQNEAASARDSEV